MGIGDWITVAVATLFVAFLIYWRVKVVRARKAGPPPQHSNAKDHFAYDHAQRIQNGGLEGEGLRGGDR
ncbi:MAG: hypothetical protein AAGJ28_03600 [Pseudomonadota bacterium]